MNQILKRYFEKHDTTVTQLSNNYFAARHGESRANVAGVVVSSYDNGSLPEWGLTDTGTVQVFEAANAFTLPPGEWVVATSSFTRRLESARIVEGVVRTRLVMAQRREKVRRYDTSLIVERCFGKYELGPATAYTKVWDRDREDPRHTENKVESVYDVNRRMIDFVLLMEEQVAGANIVLCSSADPLLILEAAFKDLPLTDFQSLPYIVNGEIRKLALKG
jgi:probable phosphoglycerate mutase